MGDFGVADILEPVLIIVLAIVIAAAVYFICTSIKDFRARRRAEKAASEARSHQRRPRKGSGAHSR